LLLRVLIERYLISWFPKLTSWPALLGLPPFMGLIVGIFEVACGLLLILGFAWPWSVLPLIVIISVALVGVQLPNGITAGSERDSLILVGLLTLLAFGYGAFSLNNLWKRKSA
jgi:uncharacterized membrane protein YphA (DoxX/SURF4 family)